jgi:nucleotide-binding universal stress UspA family protein
MSGGEHRLLVTVSGDANALWGARFVGSFFERKEALRLTLYHMAPIPPGANGLHPELTEARRRLVAEEREVGEHALAQAAEVLAGLGLSGDRLEAKLAMHSGLRVEELLAEAERGAYDAVVLGRRGWAWCQSLFSDNLTDDMLRLSVATPVWVCREPDLTRSGALMCVDGSESSRNMCARLGKLLLREPRHAVTLLHVQPPGSGHGKVAQDILEAARAELMEMGLPQSRIEAKSPRAKDASAAVLEEARRGRHAVVACGRTGVGRGRLENLRMGSVSRALLHHLSGAALWVCR